MCTVKEKLALAIADWAYSELAFTQCPDKSLSLGNVKYQSIFQNLCTSKESRRIWQFVVSEIRRRSQNESEFRSIRARPVNIGNQLDDRISKLEAEIKDLENSIGDLSSTAVILKQEHLRDNQSTVLFQSHSIALDRKSIDFISFHRDINHYYNKIKLYFEHQSYPVLKSTNEIRSKIYDFVKLHGAVKTNRNHCKQQKGEIIVHINNLLSVSCPMPIVEVLKGQIKDLTEIKSKQRDLKVNLDLSSIIKDTVKSDCEARQTSITECCLEKKIKNLKYQHVEKFMETCDGVTSLRREEIKLNALKDKQISKIQKLSNADLQIKLFSQEMIRIELKAQIENAEKILSLKNEEQTAVKEIHDAVVDLEHQANCRYTEILKTSLANKQTAKAVLNECLKAATFHESMQSFISDLETFSKSMQCSMNAETEILKILTLRQLLEREYWTVQIIYDDFITPLSNIKSELNVPNFAGTDWLLRTSKNILLRKKRNQALEEKCNKLLSQLQKMNHEQRLKNQTFNKEVLKANERLRRYVLPYLEKHQRDLKENEKIEQILEGAISDFEMQPAFGAFKKILADRQVQQEITEYSAEYRKKFLARNSN